MKKKVICRDNIYVGEVALVKTVYDLECGHYFENSAACPIPSSVNYWYHYRSMLFVPSKQKLATDLLYDSPNYPILNITENNFMYFGHPDTIAIKDACNLSQLLERLGYGEELTFEDILTIRKVIFNGTFAKNNCELFGMRENQPEDKIYYEDGKIVTDEKKLKKLVLIDKIDMMFGYKSFSSIPNQALLKECWKSLDSLGDKSFIDFLSDRMMGLNTRMDSFAPHKKEGPIKKYKLF